MFSTNLLHQQSTAWCCDENFAFAYESEGQSLAGTHRQLILARVLCGSVKEYGTERRRQS
mgnify:CR=1 FL=1